MCQRVETSSVDMTGLRPAFFCRLHVRAGRYHFREVLGSIPKE